jgi:hypothetical protein
MKKTIALSLLSALFLTQSYATGKTELQELHAAAKADNTTANNKIQADYNVRITLVDIYGNPFTGSNGLRGFWAQNTATGVYYYPEGRREGDTFESLPAGTYTFGGYPGNWDGVVSQTVTLTAGAVGSDGYIVVALTYWVE